MAPDVVERLARLVGQLLEASPFVQIAIALGVAWVVAAAAYAWVYLRRDVARLAGPLAPGAAREVTRRQRRRRGIPEDLPAHLVCGRCRSIYETRLGACDSCGAPWTEGTAIPDADEPRGVDRAGGRRA